LIVSFFDPWIDPKASQRTWGTGAELGTCGCTHLMLVEALWRALKGFFPIDILEWLLPGHWEADLIQGAFNRFLLGTLVERNTLFKVETKM